MIRCLRCSTHNGDERFLCHRCRQLITKDDPRLKPESKPPPTPPRSLSTPEDFTRWQDQHKWQASS